ncbi:MAG TPA: hypothetical protein PLY34_07320 [Ferruginibacter sp.]|nr:hypothetical protein [Ferruginibacter sp.]
MFIKTCFTSIIVFLSLQSMAQTFDLEEKATFTENGFEYGYIIKNEQTKKAGDEEFSRYEITFFIINKSSCNKIYRQGTGSNSYNVPNLLATFNCRNANGKRLTSKSGNVRARDFYITIKKKKEGDEKKEVTESVKAGFIFRNGETLRDNVIVLVPLGEKPQIQCTVNHLQELD